jgi:amidohydrolase
MNTIFVRGRARFLWMRAVSVVMTVSIMTHFAMAAPKDEIRAIAEREYPALEKIYVGVHQAPELSLMEEKTGTFLAGELRKAGYEVTEKVGGYGVVAVLKNGEGKTLLIRTDLDALPVKEETQAQYASSVTTRDLAGQVVPVMHACGHDVHITTMVGVARTMAELKKNWKGTLILIGQPAEEVGKGAKAMLADGLFKRFPRPDYALALHVDAELEVGKVGYISGYAMANVDSIDVLIRGVGGHGAWPHMTKDPIVIAAECVLALQTIASREVKPTEPVVVTVGSIHGGTKHNVIPDEVKLQLTVRTYKDEVREQVISAIERIVKGIAISAGVPKNLEPVVTVKDEFTPATYNTPELVERVVVSLKAMVGEENVVKREASMGGEDFGRYGREEPRIPICMYRLGSVKREAIEESKRPGGRPLPSLHSSKYLPEREAIKVGVMTMSGAAMDLLSSQ